MIKCTRKMIESGTSWTNSFEPEKRLTKTSTSPKFKTTINQIHSLEEKQPTGDPKLLADYAISEGPAFS